MKVLEMIGSLAGFASSCLLLAIVICCYISDGVLLIDANQYGEIWMDFTIFTLASILTLFVVVRRFRGK